MSRPLRLVLSLVLGLALLALAAWRGAPARDASLPPRAPDVEPFPREAYRLPG